MNSSSPDHDATTIAALAELQPCLVYGAGSIGMHVASVLKSANIEIAAFVLDPSHATPQAVAALSPYEAISVDEAKSLYSGRPVILAHTAALLRPMSQLQGMFPSHPIMYLSEVSGFETFGIDFVRAHATDLALLQSWLCDSLSRDSLDAYISAKVNRDASSLWPYVVGPQYFPRVRQATAAAESPFYSMSDEEVLVTCGAYDGDSILAFDAAVNGHWRHAYACEPDVTTLQRLNETLAHTKLADRCTVFPVAAWCRACRLRFDSRGTMQSSVSVPAGQSSSSDTSQYVTAATLDELLNHAHPTLISIDVEGAEWEVLTGARDVITGLNPVIALSIYHKRNDLFQLPQFLKQLCPEYRFFLRLHRPLAIDAVLYAVPPHRVLSPQ